MEHLYHYTNINSLALILSNRTLRLSRLDKVDDVSESKVFSKHNLSQYVFVSSWTLEADESIPMWHMYTEKMSGVRIKLPKNPFKKFKFTSDPLNGIYVEGDTYSLLPFNKLVTDEYIVPFPLFEEKFYSRQVKYVDKPSDYFEDFTKFIRNPNGTFDFEMGSIFELGKYKKKVWDFQKEFRYVLVAFPSVQGLGEIGFTAETYKRIIDQAFSAIYGGYPSKIEHFDLEIGKEIDDIVVTLGPNCSHGDKVIVEALLKEYTKNGVAQTSALEGTIKK